ncbi:type 1 glutamine amidotransferase [Rhizobium sp. DKSPLA3]|uniref:Type 1 glutamine amidotransferase n=1 Tax=Rhizobium quercicola TaxID=2901226 RepID=A0A9X1NRY1_9HYPH|nr:type 1 glutamine amidotransferase [Rhizobium quercicola]MCD7110072.1 type 1 glutamine amidotransferase [Rhizobium quercicola]
MHVLVVENMPHSDLGLVGVALAEAGAGLDIRKAYAGDALPAGPDAYDGMVVLGGEQSALDDTLHPYLPVLCDLMRRFTETDRAVLGICLGSQLLARAHGGDNRLGAAREFGWHEIGLTAAGQADPVLSAAGARFPAFQWHSDTFTLPHAATVLAGNDAVPLQAFRIGRASYGTQFHFEAGTAVIGRWKAIYRDQIDRIDPGWLARSADLEAQHGAASDTAGLALARAFVRTIVVARQGSAARVDAA